MSRDWLSEELYEPEEDENYISASRIKKFNKCPMQYYLSYVEGYPEEKISKGYRELGTSVHETIENVLAEDPTMTEASLSSRFQREWTADHKQNVLEKHEDDALDCLNVAARYLGKVKPNIIGIEDEMSFGLKSLNRRFLGYSDLTTEDTIIDWKTGRMREDDQIEDNRIQAAVYGMGYKYLYEREPPEQVTYVYLKEGKARTVPLDDETWDTMMSGANKLISAISTQEQWEGTGIDIGSGAFEANPGDICFWCPVENFCSSSPMSYGQVDYDEVPF